MILIVRIKGDVLAFAHGVDLFHGVVFGGKRWEVMSFLGKLKTRTTVAD